MALNQTTLTNAILGSDTAFAVGSVTGITAPQSTTGAGYTWLLVGTELMFVVGVNTVTLVVNVLRGQLGTRAGAHAASEPVLAGLPSDFPNARPTIGAIQVSPDTLRGFSAPVAGAATVTASGPFFHLTGSGAAMTTLVPYPGYVAGGVILIVFDGSGTALTWTAATGANQFKVGGTATTAGSYVEFIQDGNTALWYPSRLA